MSRESGRFVAIPMEGKKFGRWTVISRDERPNKRRVYWICRCDCGTEKSVIGDSLRSGVSNSCGCYHKDQLSNHRLSNTRLYGKFQNMKDRCYNEKSQSYKNYGDRGIRICDEWLNDFQAFHDWAIANGYRKGLSIDRIDNMGNYEPSNCQWTDVKTQSNNRRSNRLITLNGDAKTLTEWCEDLGVNRALVANRIRKGWSLEKAFTPRKVNE